MPPGRRSSLQEAIVQALGPNQRFSAACSVHALHTTSRGAWKTRVITNGRSAPLESDAAEFDLCISARYSSSRERCCFPPSTALYSRMTKSRAFTDGKTDRIVIFVLFPLSFSNVTVV